MSGIPRSRCSVDHEEPVVNIAVEALGVEANIGEVVDRDGAPEKLVWRDVDIGLSGRRAFPGTAAEAWSGIVQNTPGLGLVGGCVAINGKVGRLHRDGQESGCDERSRQRYTRDHIESFNTIQDYLEVSFGDIRVNDDRMTNILTNDSLVLLDGIIHLVSVVYGFWKMTYKRPTITAEL